MITTTHNSQLLGISSIEPAYRYLWNPQIENHSSVNDANIFQQAISSALSIDFNTQAVHYSLNPHKQLPIASLTKIMTAAVTLDHSSLNTSITVPPEATELPPDSSIMGVTPTEIYSVEELLYGLLLPSGNDAAKTLAIGLAGTEDQFVYWMNRKAKSLGLNNTHFANASGLDSSNNYSTAYDLAILSHYVLTRYPVVNQIVASRQYEIPHTENHKYLFFGNFNDLMLAYEGIDGVKPGNTEEAGSCLIATATKNNRRIIAIVLGATYRNLAAIKLLDLGFEEM
ncbi:D-alanyl-D-alanine carboxypeptidase [Patescibacteria group bacterium]|nr:D-alanyl-D-alanine carboxypeptidase [Patescibacteria group bacterium]